MSLNRNSLNQKPKALKAKGFTPARQLIANQQPKPARDASHARPAAARRSRATPPAPLPPPPPAPARAPLSAPPHGEYGGKSGALRAGGRAENSPEPSQGRGQQAEPLRRRWTPEEDAVVLAGRRANPPMTLQAIAEQLGRSSSVVRRQAVRLGCVYGHPGLEPVRPSPKAGAGPRRKPAQPVEAMPPRRCLKCREVFQPPSKFIFRCEAHRGEG
jgi:hypothetical protein